MATQRYFVVAMPIGDDPRHKPRVQNVFGLGRTFDDARLAATMAQYAADRLPLDTAVYTVTAPMTASDAHWVRYMPRE